uniref:Uncharacterized protein n=1 Tax=Romanomermis culicivorax TaxID=13658 RepID=A0A915IZ85_ROMCU
MFILLSSTLKLRCTKSGTTWAAGVVVVVGLANNTMKIEDTILDRLPVGGAGAVPPLANVGVGVTIPTRALLKWPGSESVSLNNREASNLVTSVEGLPRWRRSCPIAGQCRGSFILALSDGTTERNETECDRRNVTKRKGNFRSVRLQVIVGYFPQNYSYLFRPKVNYQAKPLTDPFRSVPSEKASINGPINVPGLM